MKLPTFLLISSILIITVRAVDPTYIASVSNYTIEYGQSVTVSWTGSCSHHDWTGCFDWLAPYQAQACATGAGRNTCYLKNDWWWVSNHDGEVTYAFEGPGDYEFRFPYCGCKECELILDDFLTCDAYDSYGTSPTVHVNPPFDLSPFSPSEQYALGIIWVLFEGSMPAIKSLLSQPGSGSCSTCFCDIKSFRAQVEKFDADFDALVVGSGSGSVFDDIKTVVTDLRDMVETVSDSISLCHIDKIIGKPVSQDIVKSTAEWITGLKQVTEFFQIIITGEKVYTDISNIAMAWRLGNHFTSGLYTGRLALTVLSSVSGRSMAAAHGALTSAAPQCMLRHPGGEWSACSCSESLDLTKFPGNRCKPIGYYAALPPVSELVGK